MIDPNSPNYSDYIAECRMIGQEMIEKENELDRRQKEKPFKGLDNPEYSKIRKEFSQRLKELQKNTDFCN